MRSGLIFFFSIFLISISAKSFGSDELAYCLSYDEEFRSSLSEFSCLSCNCINESFFKGKETELIDPVMNRLHDGVFSEVSSSVLTNLGVDFFILSDLGNTEVPAACRFDNVVSDSCESSLLDAGLRRQFEEATGAIIPPNYQEGESFCSSNPGMVVRAKERLLFAEGGTFRGFIDNLANSPDSDIDELIDELKSSAGDVKPNELMSLAGLDFGSLYEYLDNSNILSMVLRDRESAISFLESIKRNKTKYLNSPLSEMKTLLSDSSSRSSLLNSLEKKCVEVQPVLKNLSCKQIDPNILLDEHVQTIGLNVSFESDRLFLGGIDPNDGGELYRLFENAAVACRFAECKEDPIPTNVICPAYRSSEVDYVSLDGDFIDKFNYNRVLSTNEINFCEAMNGHGLPSELAAAANCGGESAQAICQDEFFQAALEVEREGDQLRRDILAGYAENGNIEAVNPFLNKLFGDYGAKLSRGEPLFDKPTRPLPESVVAVQEQLATENRDRDRRRREQLRADIAEVVKTNPRLAEVLQRNFREPASIRDEYRPMGSVQEIVNAIPGRSPFENYEGPRRAISPAERAAIERRQQELFGQIADLEGRKNALATDAATADLERRMRALQQEIADLEQIKSEGAPASTSVANYYDNDTTDNRVTNNPAPEKEKRGVNVIPDFAKRVGAEEAPSGSTATDVVADSGGSGPAPASVAPAAPNAVLTLDINDLASAEERVPEGEPFILRVEENGKEFFVSMSPEYSAAAGKHFYIPNFTADMDPKMLEILVEHPFFLQNVPREVLASIQEAIRGRRSVNDLNSLIIDGIQTTQVGP